MRPKGRHYQHGTVYGYKNDCRCDLCVTANRQYRARYKRSPDSGAIVDVFAVKNKENPFGLEPLEEAVLIALGHLQPRAFSTQEIAEVYGVTRQAISQTIYGALTKIKPRLEAWKDHDETATPVAA